VKYKARSGQDKWVIDKLQNKREGYFVDIGASDGFVNSNTYILEKKFGWKGICVEANPKFRSFITLEKNRDCICENKCIFSSNGTVEFAARGRRHEASGIYGDFSSPNIKKIVEVRKHPLSEIPSVTLLKLLKDHKAPPVIDYLSIDTEGSEWEILKDFDFSEYTFLTITVEHNYCSGTNWGEKEKIKRDKIRELLTKNSYVLSKTIKEEDWFIHESISKDDTIVEVGPMQFWDAKFNEPVSKQYKISFCTTCMDRLYNLKETLPVNMKDNENYSNLEFVILNYNSKDELEQWVKDNLMEHIESGRVSYYKTTEPAEFSMAHSRNIAFKVAQGEIVNNLDADNYTFSPNYSPEECFASYINRLANQQKEKVIFAKGKRGMHGRIGFYKKEFMEILGGYDEGIKGYGHDDHDLVHRAWSLNFTMFWWGGQYYNRIGTSTKEKNKNMPRHWKITEKENKIQSEANIAAGLYKANQGKHWGKAKLIKNFCEEMEV
jgi:FkbM family methyltransferase